MRYLGYRSLISVKNVSSRMDFKKTALKELCGDCQKRNQTCQLLKIYISQYTKFLGRVYSDLQGHFP